MSCLLVAIQMSLDAQVSIVKSYVGQKGVVYMVQIKYA